MRKIIYIIAGVAVILSLSSCNNNGRKARKAAAEVPSQTEIMYLSTETTEQTVSNPGAPAYVIVNKPQVDLASLTKDSEGFYVLFDGSSLAGWRTYGRDTVTSRWTIEDGCIKLAGAGTGEGGDLIFARKFKNFELDLEWKISEGGNSGIFYLGQEIEAKDKDGNLNWEPIYISAPEYQVLDNANHPDAKLGVNGNRQSASLYDMIPADPQNQNPYGEWNKAKIVVNQGKVTHYQNDVKVVEYDLWSQAWTDLLQNSKFSQEAWPLAFELLNNCGGESHEGYIGLQDHGNDVWYRNIRIKILD